MEMGLLVARSYLVELFLPLFNRKGKRLPEQLYGEVRTELIDRFGGLTAHVRAPASGLWQPDKHAPLERDLLVIYEVMAPRLDRRWWSKYGRSLELRFGQSELLIRAKKIHLL